MAERKVLIKYYPPNFDPDRLIKNKRPKDKQDNVRMMLPMSLRCSTCGNYLYIGTKFNMRKETCLDEDYLGIRIYRFYLKCTQCYAEVTFKTDPKNSDYIVEHGGVRNYEPWRDVQAAEEALKELKENEEEGNAMKFLENKTYDSKREMDILDALDEIKHLNQKKALVGHDELLKGFKDGGGKRVVVGGETDDALEFRKRKLEEIDREQQEEGFRKRDLGVAFERMDLRETNKKKFGLGVNLLKKLHIEEKETKNEKALILTEDNSTKEKNKSQTQEKQEGKKPKLCDYSEDEA